MANRQQGKPKLTRVQRSKLQVLYGARQLAQRQCAANEITATELVAILHVIREQIEATLSRTPTIAELTPTEVYELFQRADAGRRAAIIAEVRAL